MDNKKLVLFDIDRTLFDTETFKKSNLTKYSLFKEVVEALVALSKIARLGIFSQGDVVLQKKKLQKTDIKKHFLEEHTHIMASKSETLNSVLQKYAATSVFLVDDDLPILYQVKNMFPEIFVVWIKRGKYAVAQEPIPGFLPDATIADLKNLVEIVKEN